MPETLRMAHAIRSRALRWLTLVLGVMGLAVGLWLLRPPAAPPIRLGVVHALTGVMAGSERGLVDALTLAVEEINAQGGLLGRPLELVLADSRSDWGHAAREAERLIVAEGVSALFACWTSACRLAVKPVVEKHRHLMFYALQYEGLEQSPHIVYMGAAPNQQVIPGARWAMDRFGPRVYLVGSDYVFPRTANVLIKDLVAASGGEVLAERYVPLDVSQFGPLVEDIRQRGPDVVLNTLNGAGNQGFFRELAQAGLGQLPVVSFSVAEPEVREFLAGHFHANHHAVWGYFQSLPTPSNQRFVSRFQQRFGADRVISDPMVTSHDAVRLWATAVKESGTDNPAQINLSIGRMSVQGVSGIVTLDAYTRHLWRRVYVGQVRADGQFTATEISEAPVRPAPFPSYRSREDWRELVQSLSVTPHAVPVQGAGP